MYFNQDIHTHTRSRTYSQTHGHTHTDLLGRVLQVFVGGGNVVGDVVDHLQGRGSQDPSTPICSTQSLPPAAMATTIPPAMVTTHLGEKGDDNIIGVCMVYIFVQSDTPCLSRHGV